MKLCLILFFLFLSFISAQSKNPNNIPFNWKTDTTKTTIDLSELKVVLPRGSFQVLNYPGFIDKKKGVGQYFEREPVMVVEINGSAKAYPLNILSIHEIANDTLSGVPILATFCPLCNSGIVYDRRLKHKGENFRLDFEVSGMLRKSDMVMADKQTETWWQQLEGKGIVGELSGAELRIIPSLILSVKEFFERYPDGRILSKESGSLQAQQAYGKNYYVNYDSKNGKPYERYFDEDKLDKRLSPMERVVDIRSTGEFKIYPFSIAEEKGVINDTFNGKSIVLFYQSGVVSVLDKKEISESKDIGTVTVFNPLLNGIILTFEKKDGRFIDTNTNSVWDITGRCIAGKLKGKILKIEPSGNHFAFAWFAFHPNTKIYGVD